MRESQSSPNLVHPQRNSSIRLRKKRDEGKKQFLKNRSSGDFGYSLSRDAVNTSDADHKVGTLDPGPYADGIQQSLRPLLRTKYRQGTLSDTEEERRGWGDGRRGRAGPASGIKITDFGMIDLPPVELSIKENR